MSSLYARAQGRHARPIQELMRAADKATAEVFKEFGEIALINIAALRIRSKAALAPNASADDWDALRFGVRDLYTSSVMGNAAAVAQFAKALFEELERRKPGSENNATLVGLYVDALEVAASSKNESQLLETLKQELKRASRKLA